MAGYKVHIAKDGRSGLEIFRNQPIDLVVLDYDIPGMMGDEVAKEMRRLRKDVPLLLVTAFHDLPATCTSMFDATVVKGEAPTLLLEKISSLLPEHESRLKVTRSPWNGNGHKSVRVLLKPPAAERRK